MFRTDERRGLADGNGFAALTVQQGCCARCAGRGVEGRVSERGLETAAADQEKVVELGAHRSERRVQLIAWRHLQRESVRPSGQCQ